MHSNDRLSFVTRAFIYLYNNFSLSLSFVLFLSFTHSRSISPTLSFSLSFSFTLSLSLSLSLALIFSVHVRTVLLRLCCINFIFFLLFVFLNDVSFSFSELIFSYLAVPLPAALSRARAFSLSLSSFLSSLSLSLFLTRFISVQLSSILSLRQRMPTIVPHIRSAILHRSRSFAAYCPPFHFLCLTSESLLGVGLLRNKMVTINWNPPSSLITVLSLMRMSHAIGQDTKESICGGTIVAVTRMDDG